MSFQLPASSFQLFGGHQSYRAQMRGKHVPLEIEAQTATRYFELEAGSWKLEALYAHQS